MTEDAELLRRFRETGCEEAFAEMVKRHVDLVYSVAFRQVGYDVQLARDISQEVFVALARKAGRFEDEVVLTGWLYRCARFEAHRAMRSEHRRRIREQEAQKMHDINDDAIGSGTDWEEVRPLLDKAISELHEKDRDAICLRFFESRSFSDIGAKLKLSENASRMRVNRAIDKLSALLARDGIKSTSAALGVVVAGQASVAAPAGLSVSIAQGALAGIASASGGSLLGSFIGIINTTKMTIAWTSVVSVLVVGTAIYQSNRLEAAQENLDAMAMVRSDYLSKLDELNALKSRLLDLDGELASLSGSAGGVLNESLPEHGFRAEEFEAELETWVMRVDNLAEFLSVNQQYRIAELDNIDEALWLDAVQNRILKTEADYRMALSDLRRRAKQESMNKIFDAMRAYLKESGGELPTSAMELAAYSDEPIDEAILARYRIIDNDGANVSTMEKRKTVLWEEPVDVLWDYTARFFKGGTGSGRGGNVGNDLHFAIYHFEKDHSRNPLDVEELEPYVKDKSALDYYSEYIRAKGVPIRISAFESGQL